MILLFTSESDLETSTISEQSSFDDFQVTHLLFQTMSQEQNCVTLFFFTTTYAFVAFVLQ